MKHPDILDIADIISIDEKLCTARVMLSPALASLLLESSEGNRYWHRLNLERLVGDLRNNEWKVTGDTIKMDINSHLFDGHHRCKAVVISGVTIEVYLVWGLDPDAKNKVDQGDVRTPTDHLAADNTPYANYVASWANVGRSILCKTHERIGRDGLLAYKKECHDAIVWGGENLGKKGLFHRAYVGGPLVFAYPTNPVRTSSFAESVILGEGLSVGDPAHTLRDYILTGRFKTDTDNAKYRKVLRALLAYIEGECIPKLYAISDLQLVEFSKAYGPKSVLRASNTSATKLTVMDIRKGTKKIPNRTF